MIAAVPLIPGAAGIAELGAATLYSRIVPTYLLGLFVVLWRLILYFLNIPLGLLAAALAARERSGTGVHPGHRKPITLVRPKSIL
jgi:uncharacterized protein (TIRG00374 family)